MLTILLSDMNRPRFHPYASNSHSSHYRKVNPQHDDFRGVVSYPPRYSSRPPAPSDSGNSAAKSASPQWPATAKSEPDFQSDNTDFVSTFPKNFAQQSTVDNAVKKGAGDEHVDASTSANLPATSSTTNADIEQLKWQAGQGPTVELRLLVPGKVS